MNLYRILLTGDPGTTDRIVHIERESIEYAEGHAALILEQNEFAWHTATVELVPNTFAKREE